MNIIKIQGMINSSTIILFILSYYVNITKNISFRNRLVYANILMILFHIIPRVIIKGPLWTSKGQFITDSYLNPDMNPTYALLLGLASFNLGIIFYALLIKHIISNLK